MLEELNGRHRSLVRMQKCSSKGGLSPQNTFILPTNPPTLPQNVWMRKIKRHTRAAFTAADEKRDARLSRASVSPRTAQDGAAGIRKPSGKHKRSVDRQTSAFVIIPTLFMSRHLNRLRLVCCECAGAPTPSRCCDVPVHWFWWRWVNFRLVTAPTITHPGVCGSIWPTFQETLWIRPS